MYAQTLLASLEILLLVSLYHSSSLRIHSYMSILDRRHAWSIHKQKSIESNICRHTFFCYVFFECYLCVNICSLVIPLYCSVKQETFVDFAYSSFVVLAIFSSTYHSADPSHLRKKRGKWEENTTIPYITIKEKSQKKDEKMKKKYRKYNDENAIKLL